MSKRVLVLGGYGNFGSFISNKLAHDADIHLIVAGRSLDKAEKLVTELHNAHLHEAVRLDINEGIEHLETAFEGIKPDIVIHTCGPFQQQGYDVAGACVARGCHYVDLADGRAFVEGISNLDQVAKEKGSLVISGASSVPCLTAALVDYYQPQFKVLEYLDYGITTAQKTSRGQATTAAILSYTGKPFETLIEGEMTQVYGWQNLHMHNFPGLGRRLLGNCEIPDLSLFPKRYQQLKTIRFYAGIEIPFIHVTLWLVSWLVRIGLIAKLERAAPLLLKAAKYFDGFGSDESAFYMKLSGTDHADNKKGVDFDLTALSGDGPYIPCMPAILLAQKLVRGEIPEKGAFPCVGFISLGEYLAALEPLDISWQVAGVN